MNTELTPRKELMAFLRIQFNDETTPSDGMICRALLSCVPARLVEDAYYVLMSRTPDHLKHIMDDIINNE